MFAICPRLSATLMFHATSREFVLPMRACGVREFILGGLLYSARNSEEAF